MRPLSRVRMAVKSKATSGGYERTFTIWRFAKWEFKLTYWKGR